MKKIEKFPKLVVNEAKKLREFTTVEEREKLNFATLDPISYRRCIYGQITDDCRNERAEELIRKCCSRVYKAILGVSYLKNPLNGSPKKIQRVDSNNCVTYWSPIERFISNAGEEQNKALLNYIKKRRHSLPT